MREFRNRVAVVTGGAGGIGKALARAFVGEGMKVVIADVEEAALQATAKELGGDVMGVVTDVSDPASVQALADRVFERHGACHILCNNAGVSVPNLDLWETEPSDFQWVFGVNVAGVAHGVQAFVPRMIASGEEGFVMNTSSGDGGISPLAQQVVYASSKAAVSIVTECLEAQLRAQPLDELAQHALQGIRERRFIIMLGVEQAAATLRERADRIARGELPIDLRHGLLV